MARYRAHIQPYDPLRDGMGVLLVNSAGTPVAEIFRFDLDHTVRLEINKRGIPDGYIEHLRARARLLLDPFEDGTPLIEAVRCPPRLRKMLKARS